MTGRWKIIELSRNFGKEIALYAGIEHAQGDYVLLMDADMQHPYNICRKLIAELMADSRLDVVYAVRDDRLQESWKKAFAGQLFYGRSEERRAGKECVRTCRY